MTMLGYKGMSLNENCSNSSTNLTLEGQIFQRVGTATEKVLVPILVLTSGTKSKSELNYQS